MCVWGLWWCQTKEGLRFTNRRPMASNEPIALSLTDHFRFRPITCTQPIKCHQRKCEILKFAYNVNLVPSVGWFFHLRYMLSRSNGVQLLLVRWCKECVLFMTSLAVTPSPHMCLAHFNLTAMFITKLHNIRRILVERSKRASEFYCRHITNGTTNAWC
jgi:hypothetical protein